MRVKYEVGNIIEQETNGGSRRLVRVEDRSENIKNGYAGFDGVVVSDDGIEFTPCTRRLFGDAPEPDSVWGYDDQVVRVVDEGCPSGWCNFRSDLHDDGACPPPRDLPDRDR